MPLHLAGDRESDDSSLGGGSRKKKVGLNTQASFIFWFNFFHFFFHDLIFYLPLLFFFTSLDVFPSSSFTVPSLSNSNIAHRYRCAGDSSFVNKSTNEI